MTKIKFALFLWTLVNLPVHAAEKVPLEVRDFMQNIAETCTISPRPPKALENLPNTTATCQIVTILVAKKCIPAAYGTYGFRELQCSDTRYPGRNCSIFTYKNNRASKTQLYYYPVKMTASPSGTSEIVQDEKEFTFTRGYDEEKDFAMMNESLEACFP